ncbi:MAG: MFS transporter [Pirellulaceae bacterium]|nr:MFS transporter [Planctomycetales bacterium]
MKTRRFGRPHPCSHSQLRTNLRAICSDGVAHSLMVGIGETYVPAFALSIGMSCLQAGLIATLPLLLGGLLQLAAPWGVERLHSFRTWIVRCAIVQALSLYWLAGMALSTTRPTWWVFVPVTVYWATGLAVGPAWNTWVQFLVPTSVRPTFFARRVRMCQLGVLAGLVAGGLLLRYGTTTISAQYVFALLFSVAGCGRVYSAWKLASQSESAAWADDASQSMKWCLIRSAAVKCLANGDERRQLRFVVYLIAMQVAVYIAAPYFTPYMLKSVNFTYLQYMTLLGCGFLGKALMLPLAGQIVKRFGAGRLLRLSGIGIIPMSALWLVSDNMVYLIVLQLTSGAVWACYELAMFLKFFDSISHRHRIPVMTFYNLGNSAAMVLGTGIGAAMISWWGPDRSTFLAIFLVSSMARVLTLVLLPDATVTIKKDAELPVTRPIAVRPGSGSIERPVVAA